MDDYIKLYNSFVIGLRIKTIIYKCFYNLHQFTVAFHSHLCSILIVAIVSEIRKYILWQRSGIIGVLTVCVTDDKKYDFPLF